MPHLRHRYLENTVRKDLTWSPVVSVLGMRQVGKSTLLRQIGESYFTLDDEDTLRTFDRGDWTEIEKAKTPVVIDEAQKSPRLFDRIKLIVDRRQRPGQFILTGSVRFLSRKQIRESLTGRTSLLQLLPLTLAECHSRPLYDFIEDIAKTDPGKEQSTIDRLSTNRKHASTSEVENYLSLGGMPGICFKRDQSIQNRMREAHIETLLMRDLQFLVRTTIPFAKLKSILHVLAQSHISPLSAASLGREAQISTPTALQILRAFEDLFLIRSLEKNWYFSDLGLGSYLGAKNIENPLYQMERFVYHELYAQLEYLHRAQFQLSSYTTRGGVRIPFVVNLESRPTIAIVVDSSTGGSEKSLKGLTWFSKKQRGPVISVVLHRGNSAYVSSTKALCIPYFWIS